MMSIAHAQASGLPTYVSHGNRAAVPAPIYQPGNHVAGPHNDDVPERVGSDNMVEVIQALQKKFDTKQGAAGDADNFAVKAPMKKTSVESMIEELQTCFGLKGNSADTSRCTGAPNVPQGPAYAPPGLTAPMPVAAPQPMGMCPPTGAWQQQQQQQPQYPGARVPPPAEPAPGPWQFASEPARMPHHQQTQMAVRFGSEPSFNQQQTCFQNRPQYSGKQLARQLLHGSHKMLGNPMMNFADVSKYGSEFASSSTDIDGEVEPLDSFEGEDDYTTCIAPPPGLSSGQSMTTLMVRNIPVMYTQEMLMLEWPNHGYDFLYLPRSCAGQTNLSYAFLNFRSEELAMAFRAVWQKKRLAHFRARKSLNISFADIQGLKAHLQQLKKKRVRRIEMRQCQPYILFNDQVVGLTDALANLDNIDWDSVQ